MMNIIVHFRALTILSTEQRPCREKYTDSALFEDTNQESVFPTYMIYLVHVRVHTLSLVEMSKLAITSLDAIKFAFVLSRHSNNGTYVSGSVLETEEAIPWIGCPRLNCHRGSYVASPANHKYYETYS